ncbi:phosphatase PAP2 family protein [Micromonospora sp. RHAY321]|uniref:phosphatase PAP2 family protein n=1 Tax=Micromonospora sp. RHAY321 TaxID=2944807 RepID=UPI00207D273B|nr:phosphatase PAP2 family protein [Micromonospora sp. RHAY321]MCO1593685.1 phosphatase PAP2 family protein [Micromonospora sp. RHAY321]
MNYRLFELVNGHAGRVDGIDDMMEFAAQYLIYLVFSIAAVLGAVTLRRGRLRPVIALGAALAVGFLGTLIVSHLNGEVRPFQTHHVHQLIAHDNGVSLPSDHATAAFTVAFGVRVFLSKGWGILLAVLATMIGASRVWVGVHYPADILAGLAIAALAVTVTWMVDRRRDLDQPTAGASGLSGWSS